MLGKKYKEIEDLKSTFMNSAILLGTILGIFAFIPGLLKALESGFKINHYVDLFILLLFLTVYLLKRKIKLRTKTILVILGLFLLFAFDFFRLGIFSDNKVLVIVLLFIVFLIFKMRFTILVFILISLSFIGFAYLHITGFWGEEIDQSARALGIDTWIINYLLITIVAFSIILMIKEFNKQFLKLIDDLEIKNQHILEKESNYKEIFNSSSNAIFIHELNGKIVEVNESMLLMYKYTIEDIPSIDIENLSLGEAPYNSELARKLILEAIEEGEKSFEWIARKKDGQIFWADVTLKKTEIGGLDRVMAIVNNIDEKKKTAKELENYKNNLENIVEERTKAYNLINQELTANNLELKKLNKILESNQNIIKEKERRLNSIIHNQGEGFSINDLNENFILATPRAHEIFGVDDKILIGKNLREFFNDKEWEKIIKQTENRKRNIRSSYETSITLKNGDVKHLIVTGTPDYNEQGEVTGTLANFRDISDRIEKENKLKELNEELETSNEELNEANSELSTLNREIVYKKNVIEEKEKRLNTIIHNQGEGLGITDLNETFLFATLITHDIFGLTDGELIGRNLNEFIFDKDWSEILNQTKKRKQNIRSSYEVKLTLTDGTQKHIILTGSPDYDEFGNIIGTIANFRDITERIEREKKLKELNDELTTQKRELEITFDKLKNAQKQLIRSEKMASLGILAAGVAHEINNPLNYIMGGITGLEKVCEKQFEIENEKVQPLVNAIKEGVKRASIIVTGLNHFSRQGDSDREECHLHSILDNCITILNSQFKFRIKIIKNYHKNPIIIIGNEGKLHQAFLNILSNAEQSISDKGKIYILSELTEKSAIISIEDTGIGITDENIPKITDPFFTTKDPGKGTGLGLSIVHRIIEEHEGSIEFISKVDKGTKVIIKLPLS